LKQQSVEVLAEQPQAAHGQQERIHVISMSVQTAEHVIIQISVSAAGFARTAVGTIARCTFNLFLYHFPLRGSQVFL
jgi:hypothetical protein